MKTKLLWKLKGCPHCRGDMFEEVNNWVCLQCGYYEPRNQNPEPLSRLGRKPLSISVKIISDTLQNIKSIGATADILQCSRGYIYQELKKRGLTPKEVLTKGGSE